MPHDLIWAEMGAPPLMTGMSFHLVINIQQFRCSLNKGTQGWHLCHQNNLLNTEIIIVGMLKHKSG